MQENCGIIRKNRAFMERGKTQNEIFCKKCNNKENINSINNDNNDK